MNFQPGDIVEWGQGRYFRIETIGQGYMGWRLESSPQDVYRVSYLGVLPIQSWDVLVEFADKFFRRVVKKELIDEVMNEGV